MTILGIDTSSKACSCALTRDGQLLNEIVMNLGLTHSQTLMPAVDQLFEKTQLQPSDVDLFAVVTGPGSFTGVRIGVCAVKALCLALNRPCAAVDALDALAEGCAHEGYISPILDARRGQVYTALFERRNGILRRVCADEALPLSEWLERLKPYETVCFTGDGLNTYEGTLKQNNALNALTVPGHGRLLRASAACAVAERDESARTDAASLAPLYLRLSQAERERNERLTRQRV